MIDTTLVLLYGALGNEDTPTLINMLHIQEECCQHKHLINRQLLSITRIP